MTMRNSPKRVLRRRVFYFPGFDPRSLGKYAGPMREEGSAHGGESFSMERPRKIAPNIHRTTLKLGPKLGTEGETVVTDYDFLLWRDLVSARMKAPLHRVFLMLAQDFAHYLTSGIFRRVLQTEWRMFACFIYPYWMAVAFLLAAAACFWLGAGLAASLPSAFGIATGAALAAAFMIASQRSDGVHFVYWLAHYYRFSRDVAAGRTPLLRARRTQFAAEIIAARASGAYDEILIVGHSAGALQAILTLDGCRPKLAASGTTPLSLITIGQNISLITLQPEAKAVRGAVVRQAQDQGVLWVDISSYADWMSFPLHDPARTADMPKIPDTAGPIVAGAQFKRIYASEKLRWARGRIMRMHFLFFHANAKPGRWDWFDILLGSQLLSARYTKDAERHNEAPE